MFAAGPLANFLFAILIFGAFFWWTGQNLVAPRADYIQPGSPAAEAGFKAGDLVQSIGGRAIDDFKQIDQTVWTSPGRTLDFVVDRDGKQISLQVVPELIERND